MMVMIHLAIEFGWILFAFYLVGSIIGNILMPFYIRWKKDGRPFNMEYFKTIFLSTIAGVPIFLMNFQAYVPPDNLSGALLLIAAFLSGYGSNEILKSFLEYVKLIDMTKNKLKEYQP